MIRRLLIVAILLLTMGGRATVSSPLAQAAASGPLYAWGGNGYGQLGVGDINQGDSPTPLLVQLPSGVSATAVEAGTGMFSLAIGTGGGLYAWGSNDQGQLGIGSNDVCPTPWDPSVQPRCSIIPKRVHLPAGVTPTVIAAGYDHALAGGSDGHLYAWGNNATGELGDGTRTERDTPIVVHLPTGVSAAALAAGGSHSLAIGSDGKLYAWGDNGSGQLGDGTRTEHDVPIVIPVPAGITVKAIAAGWGFSLALTSAGKVYAWGVNGGGELGSGATSPYRLIPVQVQLPAGVTANAIAAGRDFALALGSDGKVYAWGTNQFGELGIGTVPNGVPACACSATPVPVHLPAGVTATTITAGDNFALAAASDTRVYAWGFNEFGELGSGAFTRSGCDCEPTPLTVLPPAGASPLMIAAGGRNGLAIGSSPDPCTGKVRVALTGVSSGPPKSVQITVQASANGLAAIRDLKDSNVDVSIPSFTPGTTNPVIVTVTQRTSSAGGSVALQGIDQHGCAATLDPAVTQIVRAANQPFSQTLTDIQQAESQVTVVNDNPGLSTLVVRVNSVGFVMTRLLPNERRILDISSGLHAGDNTVQLVGAGMPNGSATVIIGGAGETSG